ncbi:Imm70 family immunity protein [Desulfofundulus sp.]|uniref:Imm70 family immunity protein n=1 Tax=Desulfofundulus sp. TaxID=2282750 RepID=UPI003C72DB75
MGLDARVGSVFRRVGSYGWYHSFRAAVCDYLEGGVWGSRFPLLQDHSDCDGEYTPEEAKRLLKELKEIERGLEDVKYPVAICLDADGAELCRQPKYSERGIFCYGKLLNFGVTEEGLVVDSENPASLPVPPDGEYVDVLGRLKYRWYFTEMERVGEDAWKGRRASGVPVMIKGLCTAAPEGCARIVAGWEPALLTFGHTIRVLGELCEKSAATGEPVVFC